MKQAENVKIAMELIEGLQGEIKEFKEQKKEADNINSQKIQKLDYDYKNVVEHYNYVQRQFLSVILIELNVTAEQITACNKEIDEVLNLSNEKYHEVRVLRAQEDLDSVIKVMDNINQNFVRKALKVQSLMENIKNASDRITKVLVEAKKEG